MQSAWVLIFLNFKLKPACQCSKRTNSTFSPYYLFLIYTEINCLFYKQTTFKIILINTKTSIEQNSGNVQFQNLSNGRSCIYRIVLMNIQDMITQGSSIPLLCDRLFQNKCGLFEQNQLGTFRSRRQLYKPPWALRWVSH